MWVCSELFLFCFSIFSVFDGVFPGNMFFLNKVSRNAHGHVRCRVTSWGSVKSTSGLHVGF